MTNKKFAQAAKDVPDVTTVSVKNITESLKIIADAYAMLESRLWFRKVR